VPRIDVCQAGVHDFFERVRAEAAEERIADARGEEVVEAEIEDEIGGVEVAVR
jgi:hypothetical protein